MIKADSSAYAQRSSDTICPTPNFVLSFAHIIGDSSPSLHRSPEQDARTHLGALHPDATKLQPDHDEGGHAYCEETGRWVLERGKRKMGRSQACRHRILSTRFSHVDIRCALIQDQAAPSSLCSSRVQLYFWNLLPSFAARSWFRLKSILRGLRHLRGSKSRMLPMISAAKYLKRDGKLCVSNNL